jgi:hexosaminidase
LHATLQQQNSNMPKGRYVKVVLNNFGVIPSGMPGASHKAWLFVDEIEIN